MNPLVSDQLSDSVSLKLCPFYSAWPAKHLSGRETCPCLVAQKVSSGSYGTTENFSTVVSNPLVSLAPRSLCLVKATIEAVVIAPESTLGLKQLIFLVQEVQAVVARQPTDGELVGHFGPLLTICRHSLVQLSGSRKQFRQQPERREGGGVIHLSF